MDRIATEIARTKASLASAKRRSSRRIDLEHRLRRLVVRQLKAEIRAERRAKHGA